MSIFVKLALLWIYTSSRLSFAFRVASIRKYHSSNLWENIENNAENNQKNIHKNTNTSKESFLNPTSIKSQYYTNLLSGGNIHVLYSARNRICLKTIFKDKVRNSIVNWQCFNKSFVFSEFSTTVIFWISLAHISETRSKLIFVDICEISILVDIF